MSISQQQQQQTSYSFLHPHTTSVSILRIHILINICEFKMTAIMALDIIYSLRFVLTDLIILYCYALDI